MCDAMNPFAAFIKAGFSVASTQMRNEAQMKAYAFNSNELREATILENIGAVDALNRGSIEGGKRRMAGSAVLAKQRVAYANSGVDATVGTPADVAGGTDAINEFDALTIENNAAREAFGHQVTASKYKRRAKQLESQNASDQAANALTMLGTLASAAVGSSGGGGGDTYNSAGYNQSAIDRAGGF